MAKQTVDPQEATEGGPVAVQAEPVDPAVVVRAGEAGPLAVRDEVISYPVAMEIATRLALSGLFPGTVKPEQALAKILLGKEIGVGPVTALQYIDVIEIRGKTALRMRSNLLAILIRKSGRYDYRVLELTDDQCRIAFYDRETEVWVSKWTIEDAKRAGVVKPDSAWATYPQEMLYARAMSTGAWKVCPELMAGTTPMEISGGFDVVEGVVIPEGSSIPGTWERFWVAAKDLRFSREDVHEILGVASVTHWQDQGKSVDDAIKVLKAERAKRDIAELYDGLPPPGQAAPPPKRQAKAGSPQGPATGEQAREMVEIVADAGWSPEGVTALLKARMGVDRVKDLTQAMATEFIGYLKHLLLLVQEAQKYGTEAPGICEVLGVKNLAEVVDPVEALKFFKQKMAGPKEAPADTGDPVEAGDLPF